VLFTFAVFFFTLVRFMYGAYRYHEEDPPRMDAMFLLWNIISMLLLFVLFYFAGLTIRNADTFYMLIAVVHGWDTIWFTVTQHWTKGKTKYLLIRFIVLDLLTVAVLGAFWKLGMFRPDQSRRLLWCGGSMLIIIGLVDFIWNKKFYFPSEDTTDG